MAMDEEKEDVRKAALEFMISLSEAKVGMVRKVDGWTAAIVHGCLEGMGELADDNLDMWLEADVRPDFSFFLFPIWVIDLHCSLPRTQQTTHIRMYTIDQSTGLRAL
jgi:hypothetical protein